jgi:hypothetical protein
MDTKHAVEETYSPAEREARNSLGNVSIQAMRKIAENPGLAEGSACRDVGPGSLLSCGAIRYSQ